MGLSEEANRSRLPHVGKGNGLWTEEARDAYTPGFWYFPAALKLYKHQAMILGKEVKRGTHCPRVWVLFYPETENNLKGNFKLFIYKAN